MSFIICILGVRMHMRPRTATCHAGEYAHNAHAGGPRGAGVRNSVEEETTVKSEMDRKCEREEDDEVEVSSVKCVRCEKGTRSGIGSITNEEREDWNWLFLTGVSAMECHQRSVIDAIRGL